MFYLVKCRERVEKYDDETKSTYYNTSQTWYQWCDAKEYDELLVYASDSDGLLVVHEVYRVDNSERIDDIYEASKTFREKFNSME
jgi:hypothetical protein